MGDYIADYVSAIKGDARSLDCSSYGFRDEGLGFKGLGIEDGSSGSRDE